MSMNHLDFFLGGGPHHLFISTDDWISVRKLVHNPNTVFWVIYLEL